MIVQCQNCGWCGDSSRCVAIDPQTYPERVHPGEPMPYGECPKCHAVCHPPTPKHRSYIDGYPIDGYPIDPSMVQWRFSGPEKAIEWNMLAVVEIAGTSYHLEAIQMDRQDKAWNPESRHIVDFLRSETDNEALDTAEIEGRNYVIWMHPFSR